VFGASQYGAIWFTQDASSVIVESNTSYSESVIANCQTVSAQVNYSDPAQCSQRFGGLVRTAGKCLDFHVCIIVHSCHQ
jgi:hypothetical protein